MRCSHTGVGVLPRPPNTSPPAPPAGTKKTSKPTDLPAAPGRDAAEGGDLTGCPGFFGPVTAARSCHRPAASAGTPLNLPCQRGRRPRDRPAWTTAAPAGRAGPGA